ncbi:hypothetical protein TRVA0_072S00342 [Trichomonascus vanleenenianus]|uniref:uncharacterized protein n=1 Tax=Trichomonascus vanleenenianus TaxID=2268995 RepID=UPI003ECBA03B
MEGRNRKPSSENMLESWIDVDQSSPQSQAETPSSYLDIDESELNTESVVLSNSYMSSEESGEEPSPENSTDFNLGASLTTLISAEKQDTPTPSLPHQRKRFKPDSVRIVPESELELAPLSVPSTPCSKSKKRSVPRRSKKPTPSSSSSSLDLSTISLAAAGISLVAGLSFSAGYAIGKRSVTLRAS